MLGSRVAVIGGGPGGLITAAALLRRGVKVTVFERAPSYAPKAGGGFGLAFNGAAALKAIDPSLFAKVRNVTQPLRSWSVTDSTGKILVENRDIATLRMEDGSSALAGALRAEALKLFYESLPEGTVMLGVDAAVVRAGGDGQAARVKVTRAGDTDELEFDAVVAADGIRSKVRDAVFGPSKPIYSGCEVFYGVPTPTAELQKFEHCGTGSGGWVTQSLGAQNYMIAAGCRVVNTAASFTGLASSAADGAGVAGVYYGFCRAAPEPAPFKANGSTSASAGGDDWNAALVPERQAVSSVGNTLTGAAAKEDLVREMKAAAWTPFAQAMVEHTPDDRLLRFPMYYRDPISQWHKGRVVLLGDSAHAPLPSAGQGLNMAIEDGYILANNLADALQGRKPGDGRSLGLWREDVKSGSAAASVPPSEFLKSAPTSGAALDASISSAFAAYQAKRMDKTAKIVTDARRILHVEAGITNPLLLKLRNASMKYVLPLVVGQLKKDIASNDVLA